MADDKLGEWDIDLQNEGACIVLDPNKPKKGDVKLAVYATQAPCGTPNPCTAVPPTHIWLQFTNDVVFDVDVENEQVKKRQ